MKIKEEYKATIVGYNNSGIPLGERKDLQLLAEIAVKSGDESLLVLFEERPTQEMINRIKTSLFLEKTQAKIPVQNENQQTNIHGRKGNGK
jgi:hypothetical protein